MGSVYRGTSRVSSESVAIKVLRPELSTDTEFVSRFVQERAILMRLGGRGVVAVYDLVAEQDSLAIVMELVPGGSLRQYLSQHDGHIPAREVPAIMAQVFDGLAHAHAEGVVHRDVKPENILVDVTTLPPVVKLTDFGISGLADGSALTRLTGMVGTPSYMAPDLSEPGPATSAVDVYAAGVVLYELVAGGPPFAGGHPMAVFKRHLDEAPTRPPGMSDPLWALTDLLLAKNPADRPDAAAVGQRLRELAGALLTSESGAVVNERPTVRPTGSPAVNSGVLGVTPVQAVTPPAETLEATVARRSVRPVQATQSSTVEVLPHDEKGPSQPPAGLIKSPAPPGQKTAPNPAEGDENANATTIMRKGFTKIRDATADQPPRRKLPKLPFFVAGALLSAVLVSWVVIHLATSPKAALPPTSHHLHKTTQFAPSTSQPTSVARLGQASSWQVFSIDGTHELHGVSCPTPTECVAVDDSGNVLVSTNPGGGSAAWSATSIGTGIMLYSISCPSASECVAVGSSDNHTAGYVAVSSDPGGGSSAWHVTPVDGGVGLLSVSCPSTNDCVAVGGAGAGYGEVSNDPGGGSSAWHVIPFGDPLGNLYGVSCPSTNDCVAVGSGVNDSGNWVFASTNPFGSWSGSKIIDSQDSSLLIDAVSCPIPNNCVAVDAGTRVLVTTNPGGGSSAWNVREIGLAAPTIPCPTQPTGVGCIEAHNLDGVSCPSATNCVAVDGTGFVWVSTNPGGGNSAWMFAQIQGIPSLDAVSCPSTNECVAVGSNGMVAIGA